MDGESSAPNVLLVPMHLDALCLANPLNSREAFAQYTRLPFTYKHADGDYRHSNDLANISENILSQPFSPTFHTHPPGIHLHWALPDTLTRSVESDLSGRHRFPLVPNRWLVRRLRDTRVEQQWVVESDFLHPDLTGLLPAGQQPAAAVIPFPRTRPVEGPYQPFRHAGRALPVQDWKPSGSPGEYLRQYALALTAMGPLEWHASLDHVKASFAAYYPGCFSVFGFHDPDAALGANPAGVSYEVLGWYDRPDDDVLKAFFQQHQAETDRVKVRQEFERRFRWQMDLGQAALPRRTVCHARIAFAGASRSNRAASSGTVTLAVGNTGTEALSAHLAHQLAEDPAERLIIEQQLEALEFTEQLEQRQLDVDAKFQEARHEKGFMARAGGTLWSIQRPETAGQTGGRELTLPQDVASLLAELNQLQGAYDRANEAAASMSARLFNDWHKFIYATHPETLGGQMGEDQPTDAEELSDAMKAQRASGLAALRQHLCATGRLGWKQSRTGLRQVAGTAEPLRFGLVNAGSTKFFQEYQEDLEQGNLTGSYSHWAKEFKTCGITLSPAAAVTVVTPGGAKGEGRVWHIVDGARTYRVGIEGGLMTLVIPASEEQLAARLQRAMNTLQRRLQDLTPACVLRAVPGPRYWQPNDPVLLMQGESISRGTRHGRDGRLQKNGLLACQLLEGVSDESLDRLPLEAPLLARIQKLLATAPATASGERVGVTAWTQQPWNPFLLEWDVQFFPHPTEKVNGREAYAPDHVTRRYARAPEAIDLAHLRPDEREDFVSNSEPYRGFSILSAHTSGTLKQRIATYVVKQRLLLPESHRHGLYGLSAAQAEQYLDTDGTAQALLAAYTPEPGQGDDTLRTALRAYVTLQEQQDHVLSQALGGFNDALLMQKRTLQLDIEDPIGFDDHRLFASQVAGTVRGALLLASTPLRDFNPIRGGELRITGLRLVDTFGQLNTLKTQPDDGATIVSSELMPLRVRGTDDHRVVLAPRLAQPSRIQFRWLSGLPLEGDAQPEMNDHPATTPICGWLVPNNLDGGLMVYATSGTPLGVINAAGYWDPFPGALHSTAVEAIVNPHLRRVVEHLTSAGRSGQDYTRAFGAVLNSALDQSDPEALSHSPSLSLLMGRPLAVVRASVDLELQGLPARDKHWRVFNQTLQQYQADGTVTPISESPASWTLGFDQVDLPIRIGEFRQFNDGLLGYWKEQADGRFEDNLFYAPQSGHGGFSGEDPAGRGIRTVRGDQAVELLQTVSAPAQVLTMLVDPRGEVHATSSIAPTKSIRIPAEQYEKALASLEMAFTSAPLLTGRVGYSRAGGEREVSVAVPEQPGFTWSWLSRQRGQWEQTQAIAPAATRASTPGPLQLCEGWLKLSRETPPEG